MAFSEDGSWLATGGDRVDPTINLWDTTLGTHTRTFRGHGGVVRSLAFSADGCLLASGGADRTVRFWDVQAGHQLLILDEHDGAVIEIDFSDERYQVITRTENFARTWDLEHVLRTSASDSEIEIPVIKDPISSIPGEYNKSSPKFEGVSNGFYCEMLDGDRWIFMSAIPSDHRRVTFIPNEYRISGFAFQHDRAVFICMDGQVLLLDVSRFKKELVADI